MNNANSLGGPDFIQQCHWKMPEEVIDSVVEVSSVSAVEEIVSEHGVQLVIQASDEIPALNSSGRTRLISTGPMPPKEAKRLAKDLRKLIGR